MFSAIKSRINSDEGQSTVEAAFAIPILMVLMLLILQPAIVLYDYTVLKSASAEACRLLTTSDGSGSGSDDYVRRRLSAIPQVDIFHMHSSGCSYEIELAGSETSEEVNVTISTKLKPLPLLDVGMSLANLVDDGGCLKVEATSSLPTQPDWVWASSNGRSPQDWVSEL